MNNLHRYMLTNNFSNISGGSLGFIRGRDPGLRPAT
jgi:hypothetical protein